MSGRKLQAWNSVGNQKGMPRRDQVTVAQGKREPGFSCDAVVYQRAERTVLWHGWKLFSGFRRVWINTGSAGSITLVVCTGNVYLFPMFSRMHIVNQLSRLLNDPDRTRRRFLSEI